MKRVPGPVSSEETRSPASAAMHIAKQRVAVRVATIGHDPVDGYVCLAPERGDPGQPGTILELLNSSHRVIPFILEGDGAIVLLTRTNFDWVIAGDRVERRFILPDEYLVARQEPVEIQFMNGTTIDGLIQIDGARGDLRASDFLNGSDDFYPVLTRLGTLLVNKERVKETRLATISPDWMRTHLGMPDGDATA